MKMNSLKQAGNLYYFFHHQLKPSKLAISLLHKQYYATSVCSIQETQNLSKKLQLTEQELTKINLLIPRLCLSNQLTTAIYLTKTALSTYPLDKKSISLSILIHSLTSQPDMTKTMSFLTILKHTPQAYSYITHITTMLILSYVKKKRPKEAFKVYQWITRPGSCFKVEKIAFLALVNGFCECGSVFEGLRVLRDMVDMGFVVSDGLRSKVVRSLLMEARVREALELDQALCFGGNGVSELLDSMITNWTEYK